MADEPGWVPPGVDTKRANAARVYDYLLGGSHNFLADQDLGRAIAAVDPNVRAIARANRAFLGRAVRFLAAAGIRQFLDIGSGIPTEGNVHEVAQQADPGRPGGLRRHRPGRDRAQQGHPGGQRERRDHRRRPARTGEDPRRRRHPAADRLRPAGRAAARLRLAVHRRRRGSLADRGHAARCARARQLPGAVPWHR